MKKKWWERFIISRARQVWGWSPARKEALRKALVGPNLWRCATCSKLIGPKDRDVDHKHAAIDPKDGWVSWDSYFTRLLDITSDNLDVVCKACHKEKTQSENKKRRRPKANKKKVAKYDS